MAESVTGAVLKEMTISLEAVGAQLQTEEAPRDALQQFKTVLDRVRLSTWALLDAQECPDRTDGPRSALARFRLDRANEMYENLCDDLEAGRIPPGTDGLRQLHTNARDLVNLAGWYADTAALGAGG